MTLASWPILLYSVIFILTHLSIWPMRAPIESASSRLVLDHFTSILPRFTDISSFLYIVNKTGRYQNGELILNHSRFIQNLIIKIANFFLSKWRISFNAYSLNSDFSLKSLNASTVVEMFYSKKLSFCPNSKTFW